MEDLQKKLDKVALVTVAKKYDLKPSQVKALWDEIRAQRKIEQNSR